ncbi:MAG: hypothetical protein KDG50_05180 [Chromatiales bacterium]|nr:hypothetical protein [Chromatiales bacterium]
MRILPLISLTAALTAPVASHADVLLLDSINRAPPNSSAGLERPAGGESMETVLSRYGEPSRRVAAVGEPPISRWVYPQFTVYFEHSLALHSVVAR